MYGKFICIGPGDFNVFAHGGSLIFDDVMLVVEVVDARWYISEVQIPKIENIENEWFFDKLPDVMSYFGKENVEQLLRSDDICERARGYYELVQYFGTYDFTDCRGTVEYSASEIKKLLSEYPEIKMGYGEKELARIYEKVCTMTTEEYDTLYDDMENQEKSAQISTNHREQNDDSIRSDNDFNSQN